jgi:hypothetical protein
MGCQHEVKDEGFVWRGMSSPPGFACSFCEMDRLRAENKRLRDGLTGLISNIKTHHDRECPGLVPADCLDAIYESANIARLALESASS